MGPVPEVLAVVEGSYPLLSIDIDPELTECSVPFLRPLDGSSSTLEVFTYAFVEVMFGDSYPEAVDCWITT